MTEFESFIRMKYEDEKKKKQNIINKQLRLQKSRINFNQDSLTIKGLVSPTSKTRIISNSANIINSLPNDVSIYQTSRIISNDKKPSDQSNKKISTNIMSSRRSYVLSSPPNQLGNFDINIAPDTSISISNQPKIKNLSPKFKKKLFIATDYPPSCFTIDENTRASTATHRIESATHRMDATTQRLDNAMNRLEIATFRVDSSDIDEITNTDRNLTKRFREFCNKHYQNKNIANPSKQRNGIVVKKHAETINKSSSKERKPSKFIPQWLREHQGYMIDYESTNFTRRFPIYEILLKSSENRDNFENQEVANWLYRLDLFAHLHYSKLIELGMKLYLKIVKHGEVLCNAGDPATCLYILYEGLLEIIVDDIHKGYFNPNEFIGRSSLDKELTRSSTLRAVKDSIVVILNKEDYKGIAMPVADRNSKSLTIFDFIYSFDFFKIFDIAKIKAFSNRLRLKKTYKNEVLYDFGQLSPYMYVMQEGKIERHIYLDMEKQNRWPLGLREWQISNVIKTFSVELPIQPGMIFGCKDMLFNEKRKEKVVAIQDSYLYFISKEDLLLAFDEKDIFILMKHIDHTEAKIATQIKNIINEREIEAKKNNVIIHEAVEMTLENENGEVRKKKEDKLNRWIDSAYVKLQHLKEKEALIDVKRILRIEVRRVDKKVRSIYET